MRGAAGAVDVLATSFFHFQIVHLGDDLIWVDLLIL